MADPGKRKLSLGELLQNSGLNEDRNTISAEMIPNAFGHDVNSPHDSWNIKIMLNDLNEALKLALQSEKNDQVTTICNLALNLLNEQPELFIEEFGKPIEQGIFVGKNSAYVWMDHLYSAVLVAQDEKPVISILTVLFAVFKKNAEQFCRFLIAPVFENNAEVNNGLLLFTRILSHVSQLSYQYPSRYLIADFLHQCVESYPDIIGTGLYQEMTGGSFRGKSPLYMVVDALKEAAADDPVVVNEIRGIITELNQKHPDSLTNALGSISESGPYEGKSPLHTILTTLISSAYLRDKPLIAEQLTSMLQDLWEKNPEKLGALLTKPIARGKASGSNGVLMLVRTFTTMLDNQIEPVLLLSLLDNIISANPQGLAQALIQKAPDTRRAYNNVSALQQLLGFMPHQPSVRDLIEKLASSPSAWQLMCSLSQPLRASFVEVFSMAHKLSQAEVDQLVRLLPDGPINGSAGEHVSSVGDLLTRIKAGAYPNPFFTARVVVDERPAGENFKNSTINK
jgi:hypothetical protein